MAEPLTAEQEQDVRASVEGDPGGRNGYVPNAVILRLLATLDAARAEGERRKEEGLDGLDREERLRAEYDRLVTIAANLAPELAALRALADAVEADGTLDKTREYLRRHGPIVSDYAPHLRPIPLALAAVRAAQGPR